MKQPEALRLADELDVGDFDVLTNYAAAAELRRLHEANQAMFEALKALEEIGALEDGMFGDHGGIPEAQAMARAAIAKGEQQ